MSSVVRTQGSCVAIRFLSLPSSINRCPHGSDSSDAATCGTPTWIGKGLTCVCFKRKGAYERICINLTPQQARRKIEEAEAPEESFLHFLFLFLQI
ncbi:hypothetical protein CRYUN_Cryun06bG0136900 [Craigia yunnanensis]